MPTVCSFSSRCGSVRSTQVRSISPIIAGVRDLCPIRKGLSRGGLALDFHLLLLPFELLARILLAPSQISTNRESTDNVPHPCSYDRSHPARVIALRT